MLSQLSCVADLALWEGAHVIPKYSELILGSILKGSLLDHLTRAPLGVAGLDIHWPPKALGQLGVPNRQMVGIYFQIVLLGGFQLLSSSEVRMISDGVI